MTDFGLNRTGSGWVTETFIATADAPAQARRSLAELLDGTRLEPDRRADLELLVSELVTNAVLHSGTESVCLALRPGRGKQLRVCVRDSGDGAPLVMNKPVGGLGLQLVDALSIDWGVVPLAMGKVVWFDM